MRKCLSSFRYPIVVVLFTIVFSKDSFSQQIDLTVKDIKQSDPSEPTYLQDESYVDLYIGLPNMLRFALETTYTLDSTSRLSRLDSYTGISPFGIRYNYVLNKTWGIGLEANYANATFRYSLFQYDSVANATVYYFNINSYRYRILARLNYYFQVSKDLDVHGVLGLGYNHVNVNVVTNYPKAIEETLDATLLPLAFRVGVGVHYYPVPFLGLSLEAGLGGSAPITFGTTLRFR